MKKSIIFAMVAIVAIAGVLTSCTPSQTTTKTTTCCLDNDPIYKIYPPYSTTNIQEGVDTVKVIGVYPGDYDTHGGIYFSNEVYGLIDHNNLYQYRQMKYNDPRFANVGDVCVIKVDHEQQKLFLLENITKKELLEKFKQEKVESRNGKLTLEKRRHF